MKPILLTFLLVVVALGLVVAPLGVWIRNEFRWSSMNDPRGNFETAAEYIAHGRLPVRVCKTVIRGEVYFIAEAPFDLPLLVFAVSGPAAYVFDESGDLVDWSRDTGDDGDFVNQWWSGRTDVVSVEELRRLGK